LNFVHNLRPKLINRNRLQGVNYTLPGTAYLKFIDVWLLFCLVTPFIVFLIEVAWEIYLNAKTESRVTRLSEIFS
jgi:hypothetical protein